MADSKDEERDEEWFKEIYGKEYTGPPRPANENTMEKPSLKKRSITQTNTSAGESDEDDEPRDPNAVPTDFTSREAKVWEAKAKAVERNWKKKKEEELICRICGEYGHFPQGCPTTLGGNRKQSEIIERVPVKDKRLKPKIIGTGGATIQGIEKDTGCRLKLEDNLTAGNGAFFVQISGNNRVMIGKAAEAVKKVLAQVQDDRKQLNVRRPAPGPHNRSPNVNPLIAAQMQHIANQRMQHNPNMPPYSGPPDVLFGEEEQNVEPITSQLEARRPWEVGNLNGSVSMGAFELKGGSHYTGLNQDGRAGQGKWSGNSKEHDLAPEMDTAYEHQSKPQSIEALEHRFVQETMELTKELNDAEDKENARHRECLRDIQAQYQQKMVTLRSQQTKRREEFLRHEVQVRQQQYQQQQVGTNYYNYNITGPIPSYNSSAHEQLGYGMDRIEGFGGYGSFQGEGPYYNTPHPFNRNPGYESGMLHPGTQSYDAGRYRF